MNKLLVGLLILSIVIIGYLGYVNIECNKLIYQEIDALNQANDALKLQSNAISILQNQTAYLKSKYYNTEIENGAIKTLNTKLQNEVDGYLPYTVSSGQQAKLTRYSGVHNPTYSELIAFLLNDKTDTLQYVTGKFTCGDYSIKLSGNAEKVGIRAGIVGIGFADNSTWHACNVFYTTDRGIIYIDCSCSQNPQKGERYMAELKLVEGNKIERHSLFSKIEWEDSSIISSLEYRW